MMKSIFRLFLFLTFTTKLHSLEPINTGAYASLYGGAAFLSISENNVHFTMEPGFFISGAVGYKAAPTCLRPEVQISYRQHNFKSVSVDSFTLDLHGHINNLAYMGNLYLDIDMCSYANLYIGGGIGYSENSGSASFSLGDFGFFRITRHIKASGLAYQAMIGIDYMFCKKYDIGVAYHYFHGRHHGDEHDIGITIKRYF